jgi:hypothetical protein
MGGRPGDLSKRPPECLEGQIIARNPDGIHANGEHNIPLIRKPEVSS